MQTQEIVSQLADEDIWQNITIPELSWRWMMLNCAPDVMDQMNAIDRHDLNEYFRLFLSGFLPPDGFCAAVSRWGLQDVAREYIEMSNAIDNGNFSAQAEGSHWTLLEDIAIMWYYHHHGHYPEMAGRTPEACSQRAYRIKCMLMESGSTQEICIFEEEEDVMDDDFSVPHQVLSGQERSNKKQAKQDRAANARKCKAAKREEMGDDCVGLAEDVDNMHLPDEKREMKERFELILRLAAERVLGKNRAAYTDEEREFWMNCWFFGMRPFKFFSEMLKGPCVNTVKRWISVLKPPQLEDYMDSDNVPALVRWWIGDQNPGFINLAVDALKVDEDIYVTSKQEVIGVISQEAAGELLSGIELEQFRTDPSTYAEFWRGSLEGDNVVGGLFVIMACPISEQIAFPVHVVLGKNGCATDTVDAALSNVSQHFKELGWVPIFHSTDADNHYRAALNSHFEAIVKQFSVSNWNIVNLELQEGFMCNDAAHILKRARSQLMRHTILYVTRNDQHVGEDNGGSCVSPKFLKTCDPSLMDTWFRRNGNDSMDDFYPMWIFHPDVLTRLCSLIDLELGVPVIPDAPDFGTSDPKPQIRASLLYILPMCCMNCVLRAKKRGRKKRLRWCYVGMFLMMLYWGWLKTDGKNARMQEIKKETFDALFTMDLCQDSVLYFAAVIFALQKIDPAFSMNRIGTILDEHFFSSLRFRGGKEQTLNSLKKVFPIYGLMRKNRFAAEKVVRFHREYDTAKVPMGKRASSPSEVVSALTFSVRILRHCGVVFTKEHPFYSLVSDITVPTRVSIWEKMFVQGLCNAEFRSHQRKRHFKNYWWVHANKYRLTKRIGRQIKLRYDTQTSKKDL